MLLTQGRNSKKNEICSFPLLTKFLLMMTLTFESMYMSYKNFFYDVQMTNLWALFYRRWKKATPFFAKGWLGPPPQTNTQVCENCGFQILESSCLSIHWMKWLIILESGNLLKFHFSWLSLKNYLSPSILCQAEAVVCRPGSSVLRGLRLPLPMPCPLSVIPRLCRNWRRRGSEHGRPWVPPETCRASGGRVPLRSRCPFVSPAGQAVSLPDWTWLCVQCSHLHSSVLYFGVRWFWPRNKALTTPTDSTGAL